MSVLASRIHKQKRPQTQPGPWECTFQASSKAQCQEKKEVALSHRLPIWEDGGAVSTLEGRVTRSLSVKPLPLHLPLPSQVIRP